MEDLFNMLSSSARLDKSKRKKKPTQVQRLSAIQTMKQIKSQKQHQDNDSDSSDHDDSDSDSDDHSSDDDDDNNGTIQKKKKKKKRPKKQHSAKKLAQIHQEEISAFRRRMGIRLSTDNKHEYQASGGTAIPDPISSFNEWKCPTWWNNDDTTTKSFQYQQIHQTILANIEHTQKWMEPTPIQMQSLPALMERRDILGCAPTGSGKTGAFVLPAVMLSKCCEDIYYGRQHPKKKGDDDVGENGEGEKKGKKQQQQQQQQKNKRGKKGDKQQQQQQNAVNNLQGHIRSILVAPSRELASQLHRETVRLSTNMPGKFLCTLLSKSNAGLATSNQLGGKSGLDCLVATPLRLVECIERGMKLNGVRLIVLDEADRLLDASDGSTANEKRKKKENDQGGEKKKKKVKNDGDSSGSSSSEEESESESESEEEQQQAAVPQSGSSQSRTFLQQIDSILTAIPSTATRALFSATLGPTVRHLSESILRSPIDITTGIHAGIGGNSAAGGASEHIQQELKFVGREEGKLLAIRQLVAGGITPPVLIFMQSKERAQALFGELLYDGIRVDVIHAGRSHANREASVQKFRRGETWVLICTDLVARGVDFKAVNLVINYDLPNEGVSYVHRIGRTGRAGRAGRAITFFTEADFDNLRTIANVMRLSGCDVPEWMLTMKRRGNNELAAPRRGDIDTTPRYDRKNKKRKRGGGGGGRKY